MAHIVQLKRSATTTAAPTAGQLSAGELAINTVDETIFFKNSSGTVKKLSAMSDLTSNMMLLTGAQTVAGVKTFSSSITCTGTAINTTFDGTFAIAGPATLNLATDATTVSVGSSANGTVNVGAAQFVKVATMIENSLSLTLQADVSGIASTGSLGVGVSSSTTTLGDWEGSGNGSTIVIDDANQLITCNKPFTAPAYKLSSAGIQAKTANYTLVAADNGKIITMNVGAANTLTVPASLDVGFNCTIIQLGAGQTTITTSAGVTLNSYQSYLKISGQHGSASIVGYTSNVYNVAGSLSA
jgi:hypothetical protein